ncbi:MAG: UDP-2,3-diacylglucosamine hydrolase [Planctomycetota bacterium]
MAIEPGFRPQPPTSPVDLTVRAGDGVPGVHGPLRVFIADLHLDGTDTPRARTFRNFCSRLAEQAAREPVELFILGDLFEFWEEYHRQVPALYEADLAALEAAHRAGVKIALLSGNRDFLYGRYVRERLGAAVLGDGAPITLADERKAWLEHGDLLVTADTRYLRYRKIVRSWPVKLLLWLLPWNIAKKLIGDLRSRTTKDKASKARASFELDLDAARRRMEAHGCMLLLCGHTHVPQAADTGGGRRVLVLPAWCQIAAGYRERHGSLQPMWVDEDGMPHSANPDGTPRPE